MVPPRWSSPWVAAGAGGVLLLVVALGAAAGPRGAVPTSGGGTVAPTSPAVAVERGRPTAPAPVPQATAPPAPARPAPGTTSEPPATAPLQQSSGGDGDSWRDTGGLEYRLGLVNAPESGECFGTEATERRRALLARGFTADVYARDRYGREVARVTTSDGRDLAVTLAREGYVDDRFLEQFASENPALAEQLRAAFATARDEGAGLWSACRGGGAPPPAPAPPPGGACHADYTTCVPVQGDGSGRGAANDLDCGDIGQVVRLRQAGVDPYRLDGDDLDGVGCESYG